MIELYAITDAGGPPLPETGDLQTVAIDGLLAVCGPAETGPASAGQLWRREEILERLMDGRDLLPVRYGTRLPDMDAAAAVLGEQREQLTAALDGVRGAVELALRVIATDDDQPSRSTSGTDYLRSKLVRASARDHVRGRVHEPLSFLARASSEREPGVRGETLRAAYLVARPRVPAFTRKVADLQRVNPGLRLLCTGPWPPYSFAGS